MKRATRHRDLRLVVVLFDQKQSAKGKAKATPPKDASWFVCYLTRRLALPGPYSEVRPAVDYVLGDGVAAFAACGFETPTLAGMAREFELDAKNANHRVDPVWVHGCYSVEIAPEDFDGDPEDLLKPGHRLMELFGVEKNRYILSVHRDSSHYHVHFLYSRVDANGLLRERERKQARFMAEEACAVLAHEFGYTLEAGHLPRAEAAGVRDLASGRLTRDANFNCIPVGAQARDKARMKMKGDRLRTVALVAQHVASGDLKTFRSLLAEEGISYHATAGGSYFVGVDGISRTASSVDPRLARGKIKLTGVRENLPIEPEPIRIRIAEKRREWATLTVPPSNEADEWRRFTANRDEVPSPVLFEVEAAWIDRDVKRSFREDRRGAPISRADAPTTWTSWTGSEGALGNPRFKFSRPCLDPKVYQTFDRHGRTEFWRGKELVATARYARMTIYSDKDEDLKAALLAGQAAWGSMEIYGNSKFKKRMVKLAVELNVEVTNPELQAPYAKAKKDFAADLQSSFQTRLSAPPTNELTTKLPAQRAGATPQGERGTKTPKDKEVPSAAPVTNVTTKKPEEAPQQEELSRYFITVIMKIEHERWPLREVVRNGQDVVLVDPAHANTHHLPEADQINSVAQDLLRRLFEQQRREQQDIIEWVRSGLAKVERNIQQQPATYSVTSANEEVRRLADLHRLHHALQFALGKEWEEQERQGIANAAELATFESINKVSKTAASTLSSIKSERPPIHHSEVDKISRADLTAAGGTSESQGQPRELTGLESSRDGRSMGEAASTVVEGAPSAISLRMDVAKENLPVRSLSTASADDHPDVDADPSQAPPTAPPKSCNDDSRSSAGEIDTRFPIPVTPAAPTANAASTFGANQEAAGQPISATKQVGNNVEATADESVPACEGDEQAGTAKAIVQPPDWAARRSPTLAWDPLGVNELDTFEQIEREKRLLVQLDGEVLFAKPNDAPQSHRLCLATFQLRASRLFVEQEQRLKEGHAAASLIARGQGNSLK